MKIIRPLAIDLFCGAGGMSEGIMQAGFHIVYSNEINADAALTYSKRHEQLGLIQGKNTYLEVNDVRYISGHNILKNIENLSDVNCKNGIEAIFGGPPCQGFSRAGKQETNDIRNTLFQDYLRIISEIKPKYIVFENVLGIQDVKFINYVSLFDKELYKSKTALYIIENELRKINYISKINILNASDYGVPQNRNRLIIIGYRSDCVEPYFPSKHGGIVTLEDAISDLSGNKKKSKYQKESIHGRTLSLKTGMPILCKKLFNNEKTNHKKYIEERFCLLNVGETISQLKKRIYSEGIDIGMYKNLLNYACTKINKTEKETIDIFKNRTFSENELNILLTKKNSRIKLNPKKPSSTIMTLPDDIISPYDNRIFSVRELARLQSFDDSFKFYGKRTTGTHMRKHEVPQYSQVGNAIPPLLAKAIAEEILIAINKTNKIIKE
ncbi:DNA cytosine methyltransferase [Clostridium botulinum]|uniref:DNA cytosine methyltransferase n=1 Tax=Clostridium botulinum TaxID=1491 RepID=UPI0021C03C99|nr:DNA cytosine methyltransferase [Clostridium botulinum]